METLPGISYGWFKEDGVPLSETFDDLLESPFVRVHRSHIINTGFVKSYHKSGTVMLSDDTEIEVSGSFKDNFRFHRIYCTLTA
jgi:DNA-binding LytR/AlgR family response regulator